jgi:hypothetical protein
VTARDQLRIDLPESGIDLRQRRGAALRRFDRFQEILCIAGRRSMAQQNLRAQAQAGLKRRQPGELLGAQAGMGERIGGPALARRHGQELAFVLPAR